MGDINIDGDNNTVVIGHRGGGIGFFGTFLVLVALFWLWQHILVILSILAMVAVMYLTVRALGWRARQREAIAARADAQHRAVLEGDDATGTYGDFPPAI